MALSEKQQPVINHLASLLQKAKWTAAAISDNAIDDHQPLPPESLQAFSRDLHQIRACLETAFEIEH